MIWRRWVRPLTVVVLLAGCTPIDRYVAPEGSTSQSAATIVGSKLSQSGLGADVRVNIAKIDGRYTLPNYWGWDKPYLVSAGSHILDISIAQGSGLAGFALLSVTCEAGKTYVVRSEILSARSMTVWVEKQENGIAVTDKMNARMMTTFDPASSVVIPRH